MSARTGSVTGWSVQAPERWSRLPGPDHEDREVMMLAEAARLTQDPATAETLHARLRTAAESLPAEAPLTCVWSPDPATGTLEGLMEVEVLLDAEMQSMRSLVEQPHPSRSVERLSMEVLDTDLPAGPALVVDEVVAIEGTVEQQLTFLIFPAGTTDAVRLAFATTVLHRVEDLALQARDVAEALVLQVDPADGAR